MDIHVERNINTRLEVNRIRHSINILEDYLLIQQNNPRSIEVVRTMEDVNERCNRLREILGMVFDISVIPDIQVEDQVINFAYIRDVRMRMNSIRYLTSDIEFCLLNDNPLRPGDNIEEIKQYIQRISEICLSVSTLLTTGQLPQPQQPLPLPPLPPAQGGKKGKKNKKTRKRKIMRKKTQKSI